MATAVQTHITDDIDGSAGAETITFAFQGVEYSIDLAPKNLEKLSKALAPFIEHATPHRKRMTNMRKSTPSTAGASYDLPSLRDWARKNDVAVPARGRIPRHVVEQYRAAGGR